MEKVLGEQADVKARKQQIVIECKDLDEVTSPEDICAALREQFNLTDLEDSAIKRMNRSGRCRKCGEEGQLIKDCIGDPQYMLCKERTGVDDRHVAGGGRCAAYRRELNRKAK